MTWLHTRNRGYTIDINFRGLVADNVKSIVDRAETMACKQEREKVRFASLRFVEWGAGC